jgi:phosphatidylethanolamine-binding protein (PEBP) family uncharacterized protein
MYKKNKGKKNTKNKSKNRNKRNKRTRKSKSKRKSRMHYGGSSLPILRIFYNNVEIQNGENISDKNISKTIDINTEPKVLVNANVNVNANSNINSRYLITMVDPDAPNGKNNTSQNHNYVHWIYLQEGNSNGNENANVNSNTYDILPYAPPSPPSGIHRYKFNIYEILLETYETLKNIKSNILNANRSNFYDNFFNTYINNKLISLYEFEYLMSKL